MLIIKSMTEISRLYLEMHLTCNSSLINKGNMLIHIYASKLYLIGENINVQLLLDLTAALRSVFHKPYFYNL